MRFRRREEGVGCRVREGPVKARKRRIYRNATGVSLGIDSD
jgi:hypothetical protein